MHARSHGPYGLQIIQSCTSCPVREDRLFCRLGPEALAEQSAMRQTGFHPKGAVLFVEGQPPTGIFALCAGSVKLTVTSSRGSALILRIVEPGQVLGLSAVLSGTTHEVTAEALEPTETSFFPRDRFLAFLGKYGEVAVRVAEQLSLEVRQAQRQAARIALAPNARGKLAGLLLDWANHRGETARRHRSRFHLRLTHEELGELIGSSRETVTRLMTELRREGLIDVHRSVVTIRKPAVLESYLEAASS